MSLLVRRWWGWVRHITRPVGDPPVQEPYMDRYTLRRQNDSGANPYRVYLHHFLAQDSIEFHNHPSRWSFSVVLWGSYTEEVLLPSLHEPLDFTATYSPCPGIVCTPLGRRVHTRRVRWWNWIPASKYHRITALHPGPGARGVWTLFVCGPLTGKGWGFWRAGVGHVDHTAAEHTKVTTQA